MTHIVIGLSLHIHSFFIQDIVVYEGRDILTDTPRQEIVFIDIIRKGSAHPYINVVIHRYNTEGMVHFACITTIMYLSLDILSTEYWILCITSF